MVFYKGLQPSFIGNHGNRTLRTTGRKQKVGSKMGAWGGGCCLHLLISSNDNYLVPERKYVFLHPQDKFFSHVKMYKMSILEQIRHKTEKHTI